MEKTATKKSTTKGPGRERFKAAYMEYILLNEKRPASVFAFAKHLKAKESDFYKYFNSFGSLERSIWEDWMRDTIKTLNGDPAYQEYTVREKLLAFYFTWLDGLKENRSFVLKSFEKIDKKELDPPVLRTVKKHFDQYINDLLLEGKDTLEVAERPFSGQYNKAFWVQFMFILRFWVNDDSMEFEKTDAAIEKSVHLAFDLVGKGPIDSMIDFGKFLFQNRS